MDSKKKLWQMEYNSRKSRFEMTNYGVLEIFMNNMSNGILLYDYNTGLRKLKANAPFCCGVIDDKVFISDVETNIWAISLKTGKKLWKANFGFTNGISTSYAIDAIHSFLAMDKLYMLNWETGKYTSTNIKTAINNGSAIMGRIGIAMLSGVFITSYTSIDRNAELTMPTNDTKYSGLSSNIVRDRNRFYFADRNDIMCFDKDFNFFWKTKHSDEKGTRSKLTLVGDNLYLMNLGYCITSRKNEPMGRPFVAGYKASDGTQLFFKELSDEKKMALSVNIDKEKACMLFDDAMSSVYFVDNSVNTIHCDTTSYGAFAGFVNANEELICRDGYLRLIKDVTKHPAVYTTRNKVLEVSPTTGKLTKLNAEGFFRIIGKCGKMTIIRGGEEDKELWCIENGKATKLNNDVEQAWVKNDLVSVITTEGNAILFHLDKTI